jgi:hypothetical protein
MKQERLIKLTKEERANRIDAYFALRREDRQAEADHKARCAEYRKARAERRAELARLEAELEIEG